MVAALHPTVDSRSAWFGDSSVGGTHGHRRWRADRWDRFRCRNRRAPRRCPIGDRPGHLAHRPRPAQPERHRPPNAHPPTTPRRPRTRRRSETSHTFDHRDDTPVNIAVTTTPITVPTETRRDRGRRPRDTRGDARHRSPTRRAGQERPVHRVGCPPPKRQTGTKRHRIHRPRRRRRRSRAIGGRLLRTRAHHGTGHTDRTAERRHTAGRLRSPGERETEHHRHAPPRTTIRHPATTPHTPPKANSPGEGRRHHTLIQGSVRERCVRGASPRLLGRR